MILEALTRYYDALVKQGRASPPGWCAAKVSFALRLEEDGRIAGVLPLRHEEQRGKKTVEVPDALQVPEQVVRAMGISPNFLCDNSSYILGMDEKGKPERTRDCFAASRALHETILSGTDSPAARAVLAFFARWDAEAVFDEVEASREEIIKGGNLVFWFQGGFVQDDPAVRAAWEAHRQAPDPEAVSGRCLVTGETGPIARIHPLFRGIQGAQSSGASLVSFNAPAFESFEKSQSYNAPVSEATAFAYGTALNVLLTDRRYVQKVGDTTVVFWSEDADPTYQEFLCALGFGMPPEGTARMDQNTLEHIVRSIASGGPVSLEDIPLEADTRFYILGLAPNAARLSVRFFLQNSFGAFLEQVAAHYRRLAIVKPAYIQDGALYLSRLLLETVNPNVRDKAATPLLSGAVLRSILTGAPYPAALMNAVMLRIKAERAVTYGRAAILKAYLLHNGPEQYKEELTVGLNEGNNSVPYLLGRLFAMLEWLQEAANGATTVKDRYFNAACATPAAVFPLLLRLQNSHMRVVRRDKPGQAVNLDKAITALMDRIGDTFPAHLTMGEQGEFQLGYYQQTLKRYEPKQKTAEKDEEE